MKDQTPTCDCGTRLPYGVKGTHERFLHNTTHQHKIAVLKECGAPAHIIAAATPGTPEYEAEQAIVNRIWAATPHYTD